MPELRVWVVWLQSPNSSHDSKQPPLKCTSKAMDTFQVGKTENSRATGGYWHRIFFNVDNLRMWLTCQRSHCHQLWTWWLKINLGSNNLLKTCTFETPVLWPPRVKSWLIGKDSDAGRDWGQEEKGMTEDEMAGWDHRLDGHEFEWTPGVGDGQGGLVCCDSWGCKESDTTEQLNWTETLYLIIHLL